MEGLASLIHYQDIFEKQPLSGEDSAPPRRPLRMAGCTSRCRQGVLKLIQSLQRLVSGTLTKGTVVCHPTQIYLSSFLYMFHSNSWLSSRVFVCNKGVWWEAYTQRLIWRKDVYLCAFLVVFPDKNEFKKKHTHTNPELQSPVQELYFYSRITQLAFSFKSCFSCSVIQTAHFILSRGQGQDSLPTTAKVQVFISSHVRCHSVLEQNPEPFSFASVGQWEFRLYKYNTTSHSVMQM